MQTMNLIDGFKYNFITLLVQRKQLTKLLFVIILTIYFILNISTNSHPLLLPTRSVSVSVGKFSFILGDTFNKVSL
jgi:uncharacterized membrane protein (DUF485 family)